MQKWIQHAEKPLGHSDYTKIITQICGSNNFLPDFGQMSPENIVGKESFRRTFTQTTVHTIEYGKCAMPLLLSGANYTPAMLFQAEQIEVLNPLTS
jgi:hypothetical protein